MQTKLDFVGLNSIIDLLYNSLFVCSRLNQKNFLGIKHDLFDITEEVLEGEIENTLDELIKLTREEIEKINQKIS